MQTTWQQSLKQAITDPDELLTLLSLDANLLSEAQRAAQCFSLRVPRGFVQRMKKGDINDPLLRQVLPVHQELKKVAGFSDDPLHEKLSNVSPGLLHKYHGRVLLTVTGACAVNCRYCFRRAFPYQENRIGPEARKKIIAYIQKDPSIYEVIYSGGDPLLATDAYLETLSEQLAGIAHLKTLRIHSRLPIVLPERVTREFTAWFTGTRLRPVMVVHCNHPNEIDEQVYQAVQLLRESKVTVLNQAVLLKNVNDVATILIQLSEKLWETGILPYYLHSLDQVTGAAHFKVSEKKARQLISEMKRYLPGYLVPKLVKEEGGAFSKTQL